MIIIAWEVASEIFQAEILGVRTRLEFQRSMLSASHQVPAPDYWSSFVVHDADRVDRADKDAGATLRDEPDIATTSKSAQTQINNSIDVSL